MNWIYACVVVGALVGCTDVTPEVKQLRFIKSPNNYSKSTVHVYSGYQNHGVATVNQQVYQFSLYVHDGGRPTARFGGTYRIENPEITY